MSEAVDDDSIYFAFSATLRIHGQALDFERIEAVLGLVPTHTHRSGGSPRIGSSHRFKEDAWHYAAPVQESEPLGVHLDALRRDIGVHVEFLRELKRVAKVDIFCGYRTNCDHAGFEVPCDSLRIFSELSVPFGVSVIIA
jgi:hypothetical protein